MKRIEVCKVRVGDLHFNFGNPRKIKKQKREELINSLEMFGDFGIFLIDEFNNVIAGNQRAKILNEKNPDTIVDCKRLLGYSNAELKAINIKDNTHAGEWDLDVLSQWTADLNIDLGLDIENENPEDRKIHDMELIHLEKYDYIMIVCRNELDYQILQKKFDLVDKKILISKTKTGTRKIKARAIWFENIPKNTVLNEV